MAKGMAKDIVKLLSAAMDKGIAPSDRLTQEE